MGVLPENKTGITAAHMVKVIEQGDRCDIDRSLEWLENERVDGEFRGRGYQARELQTRLENRLNEIKGHSVPSEQEKTDMELWIERQVQSVAIQNQRETDRQRQEMREKRKKLEQACLVLIDEFDMPLTEADIEVVETNDLPRLLICLRDHYFEFQQRQWVDSVGFCRIEGSFVHVEHCERCGTPSYDRNTITKPQHFLPWWFGTATHTCEHVGCRCAEVEAMIADARI